MAQVNVVNAQLITAGNTTERQYLFTDVNDVEYNGKMVEHMIKVLTGTWKFGKAPATSGKQFTSEDGWFVITCPNGQLSAIPASGSDTCVICI